MEKKNVPKIRFPGFTEPWEQRKLNEFTMYSSSSLTVSDAKESGDYELYDATGSIGYTNVTAQKENYITIIKDGAGVGRVRILPKDTAFIGTMGAITPINCDIHFLFNILVQTNFNSLISGGTIPHIYYNQYGKKKYYVPKLQEQQKIGEFFKQIDNLISLHQGKLAHLKEQKKGLLQKMFPKVGAKVPEIRFPEFTGDWEQRKLGEIAERVTRKNTNLESTLPLTISAQYGLVDQITFFNKRVASRDLSNYILIKKGEFAYNKSYSDGYPFGAIKRLERYDMGVLSSLYIVFKPNNKIINSDYLTTYYDTNCWHKQVSDRAAEGARNHGLLNISSTDFFDTELKFPKELKEQEQIGNFFKQLDNLISLHQRKLEHLQKQKKALLQQMFV